MFFQILGAIAEFEHVPMSERTMDGLAATQARGRTDGQKPKFGPRQVRPARQMYDETGNDGKRRYTVAEIAAEFGVTRPTIYRALSDAEDSHLLAKAFTFVAAPTLIGGALGAGVRPVISIRPRWPTSRGPHTPCSSATAAIRYSTSRSASSSTWPPPEHGYRQHHARPLGVARRSPVAAERRRDRPDRASPGAETPSRPVSQLGRLLASPGAANAPSRGRPQSARSISWITPLTSG
jgi:hypothetical protein